MNGMTKYSNKEDENVRALSDWEKKKNLTLETNESEVINDQYWNRMQQKRLFYST